MTLLPFEELPEDEDTWWCSLVHIEADNPITLPVTMLLPTRRTLTPGIPVALFAQSSDGMWADVSEDGVLPLDEAEPLAEFGNSFVAGNGNFLMVRDFTLLANGAVMLAAGVDVNIRQRGTVSGEAGFIERTINI